MAKFCLNALPELESPISDDDHRALFIAWAIDLDFGFVDPFY